MAFGVSTNFNKTCVNQSRSRDVCSNMAQSNFSNDSNVEENFDNGLNKAQVKDMMIRYLLTLGTQKRRVLQCKLKDLQKKKEYMDSIRRDIYQREQRVKPSRHPNNCHIYQTRYEADGSEEDEIGPGYFSPKASVSKGCPERRVGGGSGKWDELEEIEIKLKEAENLIKLLQDQESLDELDNQAIQDLNQYFFHNNDSKCNRKRSAYEDYKERSQQESKPVKNNDMKRYSRRSDNTNRDGGMSSSHPFELNSNGSPLSEESASGNEINQSIRDHFIQSIQNSFDSMKIFMENSGWGNKNISDQQFFYLILIQNCQLLQQQQMLLYLFQNSRSFNFTCSNCEAKSDETIINPPPWFNSQTTLPSFNAPQMSVKMPSASSHVDLSESMTLNNKLPNGRTNNYWDNFKSNCRQNQLSSNVLGTRSVIPKSNNTSNNSNNNSNNSNNGNSSNDNIGNIQTNSLISNFSNSVPKVMDVSGEIKKLAFPAHSKKIYASHQYEPTNEKIRNTPANESLNRSQAPTNELNALFSKNCKLSTVEKREVSLGAVGPKLKSNNNIAQLEEEVQASSLNKEVVSGAMVEKERGFVSSHVMQSVAAAGVNRMHTNPFPIQPTTGTIRKKLKNPDVIESASKHDGKDKTSGHLEPVRPLMAAEGRSYEARISSNSSNSKTQPCPLLLLRKRPTGATLRDDNEENTNDDDDLVEADQTVIKIVEPETEQIHGNDSVSSAGNVISSVICDVSSELENKEQGAEQEDIREEGLEDIGLSARINKNGVRLSGDGEQGLS